MKVPFNKPYLAGSTESRIAEAKAHCHLSGGGPLGYACEVDLQKRIGSKRILLTTSCTHALEMAALLLELGEGDEVIVPSFTFVSSVNAFVLRGARPIFVDVRLDTLNLDEERLESAITPRTKAIVVVHYAGISCEMDSIHRIAEESSVPVIEDNAHGLFGEYRGRPLGTLGLFSTLSFHETKNFSCGEGGALVINKEQFVNRAEIIREKGTNRSAFYRGEADKYTWLDIGSSYVMSDLLAAVLKAQLDEADEIQRRRQVAWDYYFERLEGLEADGRIRRPVVPKDVKQAYHLFYLLTHSAVQRDLLLCWLKTRGIHAVFHYLPLHSSPMGQKYLTAEQLESDPCPVTTDASQRLIRLPFFTEISRGQQDIVIEEVEQFFNQESSPQRPGGLCGFD